MKQPMSSSFWLSWLPDDVMSLIVSFVHQNPPMLGFQRVYRLVGTTACFRDHLIYRMHNFPPTPVVKRVILLVANNFTRKAQFSIHTLGTNVTIDYNCDVPRNAVLPNNIDEIRIHDAPQ